MLSCTRFRVLYRARVFWTFLVTLALAAPAGAQRTGPPQTGSPSQARPGQTPGLSLEMNAAGSVVVRVLNTKGAPLRQQALVQLYKQGSGTPLFGSLTDGPSEVSFNNLPGLGWYTVQASAAGYRTQRKDFNYGDMVSYTEVDIAMEPDSDETSETFTPATPLPGKAQKHLDKGVAEFRGGDMKNAEREFLAAYAAAPKVAETNYLLGLVYLRTKDFQHSEDYFTKALAIDADHVPSLIGLGDVRYQRGDLKGAANALEKAVKLDRKQWQGFWILSEIHLRQRDFGRARKEAETAVETGQGTAIGAKFVEGEALAELGENAEALQTLQEYLKDAPSDSNAPAARQICARLETDLSAKSPSKVLFLAQPAAPSPKMNSTASVATLQSLTPKLESVDWEPVGVDEEKLPLADGVTCPADKVIAETGKRVGEFVDSVNRIDATESITHQELTTLGRPVSTEKRRFDYVITIAPGTSGLLNVEEDREGRDTESGIFMGHVSMFGLADLPLVFHPSMRGDFQMTCEGLGKWQDRATWIVYFRQRADRPERLRSYQVQNASFAVGIKGRAWISADTYQIVRLEANLMKPIPQIGLGSEEDVVEYGPVPFRTKNTTLWLQSNADIYYYYRHRPFHRHHEFSKYTLFSVSATEKIGQPNIPDEKDNHQH